MNRTTIGISIDTQLNEEEYEGFELFCSQLSVNYDEGFRKLIQIYLMTTEVNTRYLRNQLDRKDDLLKSEDRLTATESRLKYVVEANEMLEEKIAKIEEKIDDLPDRCDIKYLERSLDELSEDVTDLAALVNAID